MAKTYALAIAGALIATFTISPALSALLMPLNVERTETAIVSAARGGYGPALRFALANRIVTLGCAAWLVAVAAFAAWTLGLEFFPISRSEICGSARQCRSRFRSRKATAM